MRDFQRVASEALTEAYELVPRWLPEGRKQANEWVALNPTRPDREARSFSVNLHSGKWSDFATGDKGGDLLSLYAYLYHDSKQLPAMLELAAKLGIDVGAKSAPGAPAARASQPTAAARSVTPTDDLTLVSPVPADAPDWHGLLDHPHFGKASGHWLYLDTSGALMLLVVRWDVDGQKEIRPYTCWRDAAGRAQWKSKGLDAPRPLYHLDQLAARPDAPVMVVEGEKAADAAALLLPAYVVVTSLNGSKNAGKADWSPLAGRDVAIWPDADEPGLDYARKVGELVIKAGARTVRLVDFGSLAAIRDRVMGRGA